MSIYKISEQYALMSQKISNIVVDNNLQGTLKRQLDDLSYQCELASEKIIRDHSDEGIALENLKLLHVEFHRILNKILLEG